MISLSIWQIFIISSLGFTLYSFSERAWALTGEKGPSLEISGPRKSVELSLMERYDDRGRRYKKVEGMYTECTDTLLNHVSTLPKSTPLGPPRDRRNLINISSVNKPFLRKKSITRVPSKPLRVSQMVLKLVGSEQGLATQARLETEHEREPKWSNCN